MLRDCEESRNIHKIYSVFSKKMCTYTKNSAAKLLFFLNCASILGDFVRFCLSVISALRSKCALIASRL